MRLIEDVTAIQSLLVQNRQQTHDWPLIGLGANGIDIQVSVTDVSLNYNWKLTKCFENLINLKLNI